MARPLRLEFAGALYHVTARGDGREDIYRVDGDRRVFLDVLGGVSERFNWTVHAYCLMSNHYHLLVETPDANLAKGTRQFNGVYTQRFNRTYPIFVTASDNTLQLQWVTGVDSSLWHYGL